MGSDFERLICHVFGRSGGDDFHLPMASITSCLGWAHLFNEVTPVLPWFFAA